MARKSVNGLQDRTNRCKIDHIRCLSSSFDKSFPIRECRLSSTLYQVSENVVQNNVSHKLVTYLAKIFGQDDRLCVFEFSFRLGTRRFNIWFSGLLLPFPNSSPLIFGSIYVRCLPIRRRTVRTRTRVVPLLRSPS